jgi:6-phosphogluconolactonase
MTDKEKILIFENSFLLTNFLLKKWIELVHQAVERSHRFTVALSGGRTPIEFYSRLSGFDDFDLWEKCHIFLVDERFVPFEDVNSNFGMLKKDLLDFVNIPPENIHPIATDQENVALAAEQYKNVLLHFFDYSKAPLPRFDFILLGIGDDGHTGSLYPGLEGINDINRITIPVSLDYLKQDRVSLTLPVINNARHVIFLVQGEQKAPIVKQIIEEEADIPAALVKPTDGELIYLLDKAAAKKLSYQDSYTYQDDAISITKSRLTKYSEDTPQN